MALRFHEIAEAQQRIQNPLTTDKLLLLGEICDLQNGMRVLDLGCGKGEMLCQWAQRYGVMGVGVDASAVFIAAAKERAYLLDVGHKVDFLTDVPQDYPQEHHLFDVISWLGAAALPLTDRLNLMRTALRHEDGVLLLGTPYWRETPTEAVCAALAVTAATFSTLAATVDEMAATGFELMEMVLAETEHHDRYEAGQWRQVQQFLRDKPNDRDAGHLRAWMEANREAYLTYGRRYIGWGVFALRELHRPAFDLPVQASPDRPVGVEIAGDMLWVRLHDGRVIANPLGWYPWLETASSDAIDDYLLMAWGIEWPGLDGRIEIAEMLRSRG